MIIDDHIIELLAPHLQLRPEDISANVAKKIIKDYPISLAGLIRNGSVHLDKSIVGTTRGRLALALNYILVDYYDIIEHFMSDFQITRAYLDKLWSGQIKSTRSDIITRLVQDYTVDPLFLIDTTHARLISTTDTVYRIPMESECA